MGNYNISGVYKGSLGPLPHSLLTRGKVVEGSLWAVANDLTLGLRV